MALGNVSCRGEERERDPLIALSTNEMERLRLRFEIGIEI